MLFNKEIIEIIGGIPVKKRTLLFIPLVLCCIPLTGCNDYKFDNPAAVIRNRTAKNKGVILVYGYETNPNNDIDNSYIRDFNNVVISNLKNVKFTGGKLKVSNENRSIEFSLGSYYTSQSIGVANFKLYDNGYITYTYPHPKEGSDKTVVSTFHFTFDASIADSIVTKVYEEFDVVKEEEERFISTVTLDNFFKVMEEQKSVFSVKAVSQNTSYIDDGTVLNELKKIEYIPFTDESERIDRAHWDLRYASYPTDYSNSLSYEGGKIRTWNLLIGRGETSRWAYMYFFGEDRYEKDYSLHAAYNISEEQADHLLEVAESAF